MATEPRTGPAPRRWWLYPLTSSGLAPALPAVLYLVVFMVLPIVYISMAEEHH